MAGNVTRSAQFVEKEVLKYATGRELKDSIVLDADAFPMPADRNARNIVPAGTILRLSATDGTKCAPYDGSGTLKGILVQSREILANSTAGDEAAAAYFFGAVFATSEIVNFTTYASALVSSMPTCKWM